MRGWWGGGENCISKGIISCLPGDIELREPAARTSINLHAIMKSDTQRQPVLPAPSGPPAPGGRPHADQAPQQHGTVKGGQPPHRWRRLTQAHHHCRQNTSLCGRRALGSGWHARPGDRGSRWPSASGPRHRHGSGCAGRARSGAQQRGAGRPASVEQGSVPPHSRAQGVDRQGRAAWLAVISAACSAALNLTPSLPSKCKKVPLELCLKAGGHHLQCLLTPQSNQHNQCFCAIAG